MFLGFVVVIGRESGSCWLDVGGWVLFWLVFFICVRVVVGVVGVCGWFLLFGGCLLLLFDMPGIIGLLFLDLSLISILIITFNSLPNKHPITLPKPTLLLLLLTPTIHRIIHSWIHHHHIMPRIDRSIDLTL